MKKRNAACYNLYVLKKTSVEYRVKVWADSLRCFVDQSVSLAVWGSFRERCLLRFCSFHIRRQFEPGLVSLEESRLRLTVGLIFNSLSRSANFLGCFSGYSAPNIPGNLFDVLLRKSRTFVSRNKFFQIASFGYPLSLHLSSSSSLM